MTKHIKSHPSPQPSSIVVLMQTANSAASTAELDCTMNKYHFREPTLHELLAEPIIQDLMRRDGVRRDHVICLFEQLRNTSRRLAA
jgi:hypothetical protein